MIETLLIVLIFVPVMIGNSYDYRALGHRKDPSRKLRQWDMWRSEVFDAEGNRLRRIAWRFYGLAGVVLLIAVVASAFW